jgi:acyl-CoA reductase-like NAD-dependent aldehyde dehydrogenase
VTERCIEDQVRSEIIKNGGYFLEGEDLEKVKLIMERPNGGMNPEIVGRSAEYIAKLANIKIPEGTKILVSDEVGIGPKYPFSKEKLTQLLGFYTVNDWREACETCHSLLKNGGVGHSLAIHSKDESIIREFALKKPVSRFLVNTPSTHGAVGISTNLAPSFTLGCGTAGGSATSDNVTPENLINKRRMAYGIKNYKQNENADNCSDSQVDIESICRMVIEQLNK